VHLVPFFGGKHRQQRGAAGATFFDQDRVLVVAVRSVKSGDPRFCAWCQTSLAGNELPPLGERQQLTRLHHLPLLCGQKDIWYGFGDDD